MGENRYHNLWRALQQRQGNLTVVLENVFDPHNISAVMRTCDAVGIHEMYVVNTVIPPHKRWGFKSSGGAYKWLEVNSFTSLTDCMNAVRSKYDCVMAAAPGEGCSDCYSFDFLGSNALVFGNEQSGCSQQIMSLADGCLSIPQAGVSHSLNISVACAVMLYEAYRQKRLAGHYDRPGLPPERLEYLQHNWKMHYHKP